VKTYTLRLYNPRGDLHHTWQELSATELKLVPSVGLVIVQNANLQTLFVAASGWQVLIEKS
jgi:hypothetical protein